MVIMNRYNSMISNINNLLLPKKSKRKKINLHKRKKKIRKLSLKIKNLLKKCNKKKILKNKFYTKMKIKKSKMMDKKHN